ncbi:methyltransferase N6AMT1-like isoform X2 [Halichondria panicea]|uniref:methyltransferase N6AMT1-like isoform X2 n=1 Tax=Halichondria panicea TaxID=6063 RepID=UPI00312B8D50
MDRPTLPTPSYSHLSQYKDVYEPAEDSFLLMDALEKEKEFLQQLRPLICLEIGSGSGAVITFVASLLHSPAFYWATDVNPSACICTKKTLAQNGVTRFDVTAADLVSPMRQCLQGKVDLLIFNPPYVVTPSEEVGLGGITATWAGGKLGREVTDKLLPYVPHLLSESGVFYLIVLPENQPVNGPPNKELCIKYFSIKNFERTQHLMMTSAVFWMKEV